MPFWNHFTSNKTWTIFKNISFIIRKFIVSGNLKYLTMTETDRVWMPDTFFQNEKLGHFHDIIVPNVYVRIFPTGRVLYSIRFVVNHFITYTRNVYSNQFARIKVFSFQNIVNTCVSYGSKIVPSRSTRMWNEDCQL